MLARVGERVEADDHERADAAVFDQAAEGHARAGGGADVEVGVEVDACKGFGLVGAVVLHGGADEGEREVVSAADGDGEHTGAVECEGGLGDALVGFAEAFRVEARGGCDVARVEDAGPVEAGGFGDAVIGEGGAEGARAVGGAGAAVVELDAAVVGEAEQGDFAVTGLGGIGGDETGHSAL
ncbi:MAG: hypothetical protein QM783_08125 [Phycisphaerales bacterium]